MKMIAVVIKSDQEHFLLPYMLYMTDISFG